tara:strand:- start:760 stop:1194 length:435 start_codon:yes stop_codon:yes gene_type:complete
MARNLFKVVNGQLVQLGASQAVESEMSPVIVDDTLPVPLRNPATGVIYTSRSDYLKSVTAAGCRVVGNDWMNEGAPRNDVKDKITDEKIMDAIHKAEAIEYNPDKRAEKRYQEQRDLERFYGRQHDKIKAIYDARGLTGRDERR